jgi:hypothetical protein
MARGFFALFLRRRVISTVRFREPCAAGVEFGVVIRGLNSDDASGSSEAGPDSV